MLRWGNTYPTGTNQTKAGITMLISNKTEFKPGNVSGIKKGISE